MYIIGILSSILFSPKKIAAGVSMKKALVVGINYKNDRDIGLLGCLGDAAAEYTMLCSNLGFSPENVLIMTDDTEVKPTAENIIKGWRWLLTKLSAKDFSKTTGTETDLVELDSTLYFHYSGHGMTADDTNGDEKGGKDSCFVPIDYLTSGIIADDVIRSVLTSKVPLGVRLYGVIDACFFGTGFDNGWMMNISHTGDVSFIRDKSYPDLVGDVILFSGSTDQQPVADFDGYGVFTKVYLEILKANNYKITCDKLLIDTRSRFIKDNRGWQTPQLSSGSPRAIDAPFI